MKMLAPLIAIFLCLSVFACGSEQTTPLSFIDLMEIIPLPPDGGYWQSVYLNDYKRMQEAHGIQAP